MIKLYSRVTSIEKFNTCPYMLKFWAKSFEWTNFLEYWNIIHIAHQSTLIAKRLLQNSKSFSLSEKTDIRKMINTLVPKTMEKYIWEHKAFELWLDQTFSFNVDWQDVELFVEWHMDYVKMILKDDGTFECIIIDFKTAQWEWSEEYKESVMQNKIYSYLVMKKFWLTEITFKYVLYIKKSTPYIVEYHYDYLMEDLQPLVEWLMKKYCEAEIRKEFPTKCGKHCFWQCWAKDTTCPSYNKKIIVDDLDLI